MSDDATGGESKLGPAAAAEVLKFVLRHAPVRVWELDTQGVFLMNDGNPETGVAPGSLVGSNARRAFSHITEGLASVERALGGTESSVRFAREGMVYDLL